jgi:hypothetical protein
MKHLIHRLGLTLILSLLSIFMWASAASAASLDVEVLDDDIDAGGGVTCDNITEGDLANGDGDTTLREAYCVAINNAESDTITSSAGSGTITLASNFPAHGNSDGIDIDGNGAITLDATNTYTCFSFWGGVQDMTIRGFTLTNTCRISDLTGSGHVIGGADSTDRNIFLKGSGSAGTVMPNVRASVTIQNNYFGVQSDGTTTDMTGGIEFYPGDIETSTVKDNVFAVTSGYAISSAGDITGTLLITGNKIGIGADGTTALGAVKGINIGGSNDPLNVIIGGDESAERNLIGGVPWGAGAIQIGDIGDITISGNYLGTDSTGNAAIANGEAAIKITSDCTGDTCIVGGATAGERNIIAGNTVNGISIADGADNWQIQNNYIGIGADGTVLANASGIAFGSGTITDIVIGEDSATPGTYNIISGNTTAGIYFASSSATGVIINGNYVGTNAAGTAAIANGDGMHIENGSPTLTIGNSSATTPTNVFSGNTDDGLSLHQAAGSTINVYSSIVGLNAAGDAAIANGDDGIYGDNPFTNIGGNSLTTGFNVISGNTGCGIYLTDAATTGTISGNLVGTNLLGTAAVANGEKGISINGMTTSGVTIGDSTSASATNVISGNTDNGIFATGSTGVEVYSSYVGTNKACTAAIANGNSQIKIVSDASTVIGNTTSAGSNVIGGTLYLPGAGGTIKGNYIGTDPTKAYDFGSTNGILGGSSGITVGSIVSGEENVLANHSAGIYMSTAASANNWRGNIFINNTAEITLETPGDRDISGTSITFSTTSLVNGTTDFADGETIDVYSKPTAAGESVWEGATTVASGAFSLAMDFAAEDGELYFVIATDASDNSSAASSTADVTDDSTAPTAPIMTSSTAATATAAYTLTGTKEANTSVLDGAAEIVANNASTAWSDATTLVEGTNTFSLTSKDWSDNQSTANEYSITLDTVDPSTPTLSYSSTVSETSTVISGSGTEAGGNVYLATSSAGAFSDTGTDVDVAGGFSITVAITENVTNTRIIKIIDAAGNVSGTATATITGQSSGGAGYVSQNSSSGSSQSEDDDEDEDGDEEDEEDEGEQSMAGEEETEATTDKAITTDTTTTEANTGSTTTEANTGSTTTETDTPPVDTSESIETVTVEIKDDELPAPTEATEAIKAIKELYEFIQEVENGTTDSDNDGISDREEVTRGLDPENSDTDGDGVDDTTELELGTDPTTWDSDNDGIPDEVDTNPTEYSRPYTPTPGQIHGYVTSNNLEITIEEVGGNDTDGDGISDLQEFELGTDPNDADSDGDGLKDGDEVNIYDTNPNDSTSADQVKDLQVTNLNKEEILPKGPQVISGRANPNTEIKIYKIDVDGNQVLIAETKTDKQGKYNVLTIALEPGKHHIVAVSENKNKIEDISKAFTINVTENTNVIAPKSVAPITLEEEKTTVTKNANLSEKQPVLRIDPEANHKLVVIWQSTVYSQTLISDTTGSQMNIRPSEKLPAGNHTVTYYSVDRETNAKSAPKQIPFSVSGTTAFATGDIGGMPVWGVVGGSLAILLSLTALAVFFRKHKQT